MIKRLLIVGVVAVGLYSLLAIWYFLEASNKNDLKYNPELSSDTKQSDDSLVCLARLSQKQLIAQKIMLAGYASHLSKQAQIFADSGLGGVIIMDETPKDSISHLKQTMPIPPIIAVDQEGGTVQRYQTKGRLPGAEEMAKQQTTTQAYQQYLADSQFLNNQGITTNFAPVVDILSHKPNPLPGRMFSDNPKTVSDYAATHIKAAKKAGITPVIKHFPGLGSASGNTDFTATKTDDIGQLRGRDLIPYQELAFHKPDVMVGNMIVPGLTNGQPAIWSRQAIELLRSIGYQHSVVYSDSLTAMAVPGSISDATIKSWQAGIDIVVIVQAEVEPSDLINYIDTIINQSIEAIESGQLDSQELSQSVLRILNHKQVNPCSISD